MSTAAPPPIDAERDELQPRSRRGTPVWEIARLFPEQGAWSEEDYLSLETNHLVEFEDGCVEFLPLPSISHQALSRFLFRLLDAYVVKHRLGDVYYSPLPVRLRSGKYREPDIVFVRPEQKRDDRFAEGADLAVEIISPGRENRKRDLEEKRAEYATAGILEYWIVDPEQKTVTVLTLEDDAYRVHGEFQSGETATSLLLAGFSVDVADLFAASGNSS